MIPVLALLLLFSVTPGRLPSRRMRERMHCCRGRARADRRGAHDAPARPDHRDPRIAPAGCARHRPARAPGPDRFLDALARRRQRERPHRGGQRRRSTRQGAEGIADAKTRLIARARVEQDPARAGALWPRRWAACRTRPRPTSTRSKRQSHGRCRHSTTAIQIDACSARSKASRRSFGRAARSRKPQAADTRRPSRRRRPRGPRPGRRQAHAHSPFRHAGADRRGRGHPTAARSRRCGPRRRGAPPDDDRGPGGDRRPRAGCAPRASRMRVRASDTKRCRPGAARSRKRRASRSSTPRRREPACGAAGASICSAMAVPRRSVEPLKRIATRIHGPSSRAWHRPAHAARGARARCARRRAGRFWRGSWRTRSGRCACMRRVPRAVGAVDELETAGARSHDNVREAALGELVTLKRPEAVAVALDALTAPDYQLLMTASRALARPRDTRNRRSPRCRGSCADRGGAPRHLARCAQRDSRRAEAAWAGPCLPNCSPPLCGSRDVPVPRSLEPLRPDAAAIHDGRAAASSSCGCCRTTHRSRRCASRRWRARATTTG